MKQLSIEGLKKMRERYLWNGVSEVTAVLDELLAIRELKGDQAPVTDGDINDITLEHLGKWPSFEAQSWACKVAHAVLKHTAPQKPVVLPAYRCSPDMHTKKYYETIGFNIGLDACKAALIEAEILFREN